MRNVNSSKIAAFNSPILFLTALRRRHPIEEDAALQRGSGEKKFVEGARARQGQRRDTRHSTRHRSVYEVSPLISQRLVCVSAQVGYADLKRSAYEPFMSSTALMAALAVLAGWAPKKGAAAGSLRAHGTPRIRCGHRRRSRGCSRGAYPNRALEPAAGNRITFCRRRAGRDATELVTNSGGSEGSGIEVFTRHRKRYLQYDTGGRPDNHAIRANMPRRCPGEHRPC